MTRRDDHKEAPSLDIRSSTSDSDCFWRHPNRAIWIEQSASDDSKGCPPIILEKIRTELLAATHFQIHVEHCVLGPPGRAHAISLRSSPKRDPYTGKFFELHLALEELNKRVSLLKSPRNRTILAFANSSECSVVYQLASSESPHVQAQVMASSAELKFPRLGSFEVILYFVDASGNRKESLIFSKLHSEHFPIIGRLVAWLTDLLSINHLFAAELIQRVWRLHQCRLRRKIKRAENFWQHLCDKRALPNRVQLCVGILCFWKSTTAAASLLRRSACRALVQRRFHQLATAVRCLQRVCKCTIVRQQHEAKITIASCYVKLIRGYLARRLKDALSLRKLAKTLATSFKSAFRFSRSRGCLRKMMDDRARQLTLVISLQTTYRRRISLKIFRNLLLLKTNLDRAACLLQITWRMHRARKCLGKRKYEYLNLLATKIQSRFRGHMARVVIHHMRFEAASEVAAGFLQSAYRMHRARNNLLGRKRAAFGAAALLQNAYRIHQARSTLGRLKYEDHMRTMAITLQSVFRGHEARKTLPARMLLRVLQNSIRMHRARGSLLHRLVILALRLQRVFRGHQARMVFSNLSRARAFGAAVLLQNACRMREARRAYAILKHAELSSRAIRLQCIFRGYKARHYFRDRKVNHAASVLQSARRARQIRAQHLRSSSAIRILNAYRGSKARQLLVITRKQRNALHQSALIITAAYRAHSARKRRQELAALKGLQRLMALKIQVSYRQHLRRMVAR